MKADRTIERTDIRLLTATGITANRRRLEKKAVIVSRDADKLVTLRSHAGRIGYYAIQSLQSVDTDTRHWNCWMKISQLASRRKLAAARRRIANGVFRCD